MLKRQGKADTDIATASDDDTPHRVIQLAHLAHENPDVLSCGNEKYFITFTYDGVSVRLRGFAVAINCRNATFGIRNVFF